jgi:hypothetical protein
MNIQLNPSLKTVLEDRWLLNQFREFCKYEMSVENIDFIIDMRKFKKGGIYLLLYSYIYSKYIKKNARSELNLPNYVVKIIHDNMNNNQIEKVDVFNEAYDHIVTTIQLDTLKRFHIQLQTNFRTNSLVSQIPRTQETQDDKKISNRASIWDIFN